MQTTESGETYDREMKAAKEYDEETGRIDLLCRDAYHYLEGFLAHAGFAEGSRPKKELDVLRVEVIHYMDIRKGEVLP